MEAAIYALTSKKFDEIFALFGIKKSERIDPLITELSSIGDGTNGEEQISDELAKTKDNLGGRILVTEEAVEANKKYDDRAIASTATPDDLPADEVTVATSSQIEAESQPIPQKPSA
ncbi:uncharacterized protein CDV56_100188, partial [Aspergillus thermomutatus]